MSDLVLEFYSEEIPSRMQYNASLYLENFFIDELLHARLNYAKLNTFVTPRRLTLIINDLSESSKISFEEKRGPRVGSPSIAIEGFARSLNIDKSLLYTKKEKKGEFYFYKSKKKSIILTDIIGQISKNLLTNFPWKRSMRWGEGNLRWVRPLKFIYCSLFNNENDFEIIDLKLNEVKSVNFTFGHYLISSKKIYPKSVSDYLQKLFENKVILDRDERKKIIIDAAKNLIKNKNSSLIFDEELIEEIVGLIEWPVVFLGQIDKEFLTLPKEILRVTMKEHQKFLSVLNENSNLIDQFIVVANMMAKDGGKAILDGNTRVLRSRLKDAKFFFENDLRFIKTEGISSLTKNLNKVTFHNKIGSQLDRIKNIEELSKKISHLIGADSSKCVIASRICKTDLVTQVVSEFPELQGIIGKIYADKEGIDKIIANSIEEHYWPMKLNDKVPTKPISIVLALADKINTLISFWKINEKPTSSKDPYALRRSAIGLIRILIENKIDLDLGKLIHNYLKINVSNDLIKFIEDRFRVYLLEKEISHDLLDACLELFEFNNPFLFYLKIESLKSFQKTKEFNKLINSYKRPVNILNSEEKKSNDIYSGEPLIELFEKKDERELYEKLITVEKNVINLIKRNDYKKALILLSTFDHEIENFFENVVINVADKNIKTNRLNLCNKVRKIMHSVACFGHFNV